MSEPENIDAIKQVYAAFGIGDVPGIVARLTDDVRWITHLDPIVPWNGDYSGKDRVPTFFAAIFGSVDVEAFEPQEWIAQGDTVVSIGEFAFRARSTGRSARTRWVFIWKFRGSQICSYEQFHDESLANAFK
jgi:ketosteroid isomerase-like protein